MDMICAAGKVLGDAAFRSRRQLVAQTDVGKRSPHHHFMVAAARTIRIEVTWRHAVFLQIFSRRTVGLDRSRRRNMIGGYAVAQLRQHARALDLFDWSGPCRHVVEIRCALDVGGVAVPQVGLAFGNRQALPFLVAIENRLVILW